MLKNIFVFILLLSISWFAFAELTDSAKDKLDTATENLFSTLEKKYTKQEEKDILVKLNKKLFALKIKNKDNTAKYESLSYLQKNVMNELYKINSTSKKTTHTPKKTIVVQNPVIIEQPPVVIKQPVVTQPPVVNVKTPVVDNSSCPTYYIHKDINASTFWVWEWADASNWYISNVQSAWDGLWYEHFKNWTENKFYIALPYNDFDANWNRRKDVVNIPWYNSNIKSTESVVKNKWVKVEYNWKVAYGQWEDVWPFHEDDFNYVFGTSKPKNKTLLNAWIDLSPDLANFIWFNWSWKVNWNFIADNCVPKWDWTKTITKNGIYW